MNNQRIKFDLPLPSISLQRFIEKMLSDDDFFSFALESPVGAMKECGVNLDTKKLLPSDLASFFGALDGLKAILKEKKIEDMTFENIFGQKAHIRGAILDQEISRGFFREWDNRDAITDKTMCYSINQRFETLRERIGSSFKNMIHDIQVRIIIDAQWETSGRRIAENKDDVATEINKESDASVEGQVIFAKTQASFAGRLEHERLRGPLINPVDLAMISSRIQVFAMMLKNS